jgi:uncharacterized protein YcbK (DUF882 family)
MRRSAALALLALWLADKPAKFDTKSAGFAITFAGETAAYRDLSASVLPGATLPLEASGPPGDYGLRAADGVVTSGAPRQWHWRAPREPGLYDLHFDGPVAKDKSQDAITLHVFVMVPATDVHHGFLNGYRIGEYPAPMKGNPAYLPPRGYVEVTKDNEDTKVSPHFRLKQFLCKEDPTKRYPKYVVLQERLLLKLEAILERVNAIGFKTDTLHVMSAYRTPFYNHAIGDVKYSMHQFGSAADIFVDPDKKDRMQDLNRDGRVDISDSKFLFDQIEQMLAENPYRKLQGGMGFYPATSAHPPFVHVDVRGTRARWQG